MAPVNLAINQENWQVDYLTAVQAVTSLSKNIGWNSAPEPGLSFPPMPVPNAVFWFGASKNLSLLNPGGSNALDYVIWGEWPMAIEQAFRLQAQWNGGVIVNVWTPQTGDGINADQTAILSLTNAWGSLGAQ
jgi:hypothetical protein